MSALVWWLSYFVLLKAHVPTTIIIPSNNATAPMSNQSGCTLERHPSSPENHVPQSVYAIGQRVPNGDVCKPAWQAASFEKEQSAA